MVGYNGKEKELSEFWHGLAGTLSGMATRFFCQPFDVLKIRFQLQHEPLKRGERNYYWGLSHACKRIWSEESLRGLWKGHVPAQVLSGVYGLVQFGTFEYLTKFIHLHVTQEHTTMVHFVCGSVSGGIATVCSFPFDTVRTRLVGQGEPKMYNGIFDAFRTMAKREGVLSVYKGQIPALLQIMPHAGAQFAAFHVFYSLTSKIKENYEHPRIRFWHNLFCGAAAGLVAKLVIYPLDLTKKRLQIQGFEEARKKFGKMRHYSGTYHCLKIVLLNEGVAGLYKGVLPSLLKAVVTSGLIFGTYEEILEKIREYMPAQ